MFCLLCVFCHVKKFYLCFSATATHLGLSVENSGLFLENPDWVYGLSSGGLE